ncbi:MAG TPA: M1 family metallopeptidase [Acidobacteriota bacterium]|nr:M1 family metallopeptidase [Acidobacteriota bacterium]
MRLRSALLGIAFIVMAAAGCGSPTPEPADHPEFENMGIDVHSYSRPEEVAVRHLDLDIKVDFERNVIAGTASLQIDNKTQSDQLHLDSRGLTIQAVRLEDADNQVSQGSHEVGRDDPQLGQELILPIEPDTRTVHIDYESSPEAAALMWLGPELTADKAGPFLLSQSQAILARTWVPCQDSPKVRMTYAAQVEVPQGLMAVMSASNPQQVSEDGRYSFEMPQPIPSYLLAIAVGKLEFQSLSPRTGVYAEPSVLERAAWELADTEKMVAAAEKLYGPYQWERYDMIVLPPSFPFGGMENPRLTFLTPTMLAGDRSLVALIAHELAHSWSGNLVTDSTWNDFWLNEGFTTYIEHRIMEKVYGDEVEEMLAVLELEALRESLASDFEDARETWLYLDLQGRNPDDGMNSVAYDKGHFFLRMVEETVGRERFDPFLRGYFDHFAFQSVDTAQFVAYLRDNLMAGDEQLAQDLRIDEWVYGPGLPENCPEPQSTALQQVEAQLQALNQGTAPADLDTEGWTTHHYLYFLRNLPQDLSEERLAGLDAAFSLSETGNSEILCQWLGVAVEHDYRAADQALEAFLSRQGRRKFLMPLYGALVDVGRGDDARRIYDSAKFGYHSVSRNSVEGLLN